jgi:hypothetical protein
MIVASLNCNKRLGNPKVLGLIENWLAENKVDVFLAQEPWPHGRTTPIDLLHHRPLGGNSRVYSWVKDGYEVNQGELVQPYWHVIKVGYLYLHNVYLDAYRQQNRAEQLARAIVDLQKYGDQPQVVMGDFNLAPKLEDGLIDSSPSKFNGPIDREPFSNLLSSVKLVDATSAHLLGRQEFTIDRSRDQSHIRFRCDLCLISDYLFATDAVQVKYDHTVRSSAPTFSDHSAIVIDLPVTLARKKQVFQRTLFSLDDSVEPVVSHEHCPHKTAIARDTPSPVAKLITDKELVGRLGGVHRLLDYGCGRGRDLAHYRSHGFDAVGYDPYAPFGFSDLPSGLFDLVTIVFVINVLPNSYERLQVIQEASRYVRKGGYLFLAARSPKTILEEAVQHNWREFNDGYWSHEAKGTFQKGIAAREMVSLANRADLVPHPLTNTINLGQSTSHLLLVKY